jgi:hypothetical protein
LQVNVQRYTHVTLAPKEPRMPLQNSMIVGARRIDSMELWDRDYLDLEVPAHITFDRDRLGSFQFGAVRGWIDYRLTEIGDVMRVDFSWEGFNDSDPSCGRAWATVTAGRLEGRFYLHNGDESAFTATRIAPKTRGRHRGVRRPTTARAVRGTIELFAAAPQTLI